MAYSTKIPSSFAFADFLIQYVGHKPCLLLLLLYRWGIYCYVGWRWQLPYLLLTYMDFLQCAMLPLRNDARYYRKKFYI